MNKCCLQTQALQTGQIHPGHASSIQPRHASSMHMLSVVLSLTWLGCQCEQTLFPHSSFAHTAHPAKACISNAHAECSDRTHLARLYMGVEKVSTVHISDAPVGVICRLPVLLGFTHQPSQDVLLVALSLRARGEVGLGGAIPQHLVLHQHCTPHKHCQPSKCRAPQHIAALSLWACKQGVNSGWVVLSPSALCCTSTAQHAIIVRSADVGCLKRIWPSCPSGPASRGSTWAGWCHPHTSTQSLSEKGQRLLDRMVQ